VELQPIYEMERATRFGRAERSRIGVALLFVAARLTTVPLVGVMAGRLYLTIRGMMLP
jgi:hypothetical protein